VGLRQVTSQQLPPWKALREAAGLTQREVARRTNINSGRLSVIERGLIPTDDEAARLRAVLVAAMSEPKGEDVA
jgi:transcriptional regulator with XRE-family HTH domain